MRTASEPIVSEGSSLCRSETKRKKADFTYNNYAHAKLEENNFGTAGLFPAENADSSRTKDDEDENEAKSEFGFKFGLSLSTETASVFRC